MSDSEQMGRCRRELDAAYRATRYKPEDSDLVIADAIDRLAADVASIKAKIDAVAPEDVRHLVESEKAFAELFAEQRDAAIRQRNEARAEVERLRAEVERLKESRDAANRLYGAAQAEVERLRAELAARPADGNRQATLDSSLAARPAGNSPQIPDSLPADPPPAGWLTDEERHILGAHLQSLREQRRAMERGGQTLGYSANPCAIKREADVIDNLLARAGSPPVVEVPVMDELDAPARVEARAYRAAMEKAGVKWKEKEV